MKKKFMLFILIASWMVFGVANVKAIDTNNFYFSDFTGDYYLSKDKEGVSHLKVIESVTAVFPDYNQNKGICRSISFSNNGGKNITLPSLTSANIKVTRNGLIEPIYSIDRGDGYYTVCTGTEEYVLGEQTYVFEYEHTNVVTEFDEGNKVFQELYWDTNGNGALQRFDSVTARLHFEDDDVWTGDSWCYVGKYGEDGSDRCTITRLEDGVEFETKNVLAKENLTFDVELKPNSFKIPELKKNYTYVGAIIIIGLLCLVFIGFSLRKYLKNSWKRKYYKGLFVKPEYQPSKDYSLAEMAEVYLGKKKDAKVAMLLEMIVNHKIDLIKGEKKKDWSLEIKDLDGVREESIDLLSIINGGTRPVIGDEIKVERHTASNRLVTLGRAIHTKVLGDLKRDELVDEKYNSNSSVGTVGNIVSSFIVGVFLMMFFGAFAVGFLDNLLGVDAIYGEELVFGEYFYQTVLIMLIITIGVWAVLSGSIKKYNGYTKKGLEASRYMDGLRLYISMAEADRMKLLQSVKGADVSAKGIVKLYEKLLPYAAVFGLEESWMDEMKEYCKVEEIEEPGYLMTGIVASDFVRAMHTTANYATSSTIMSSSGGSSSSGFSGGGGGGFSGGGGGGGGFSGR